FLFKKIQCLCKRETDSAHVNWRRQAPSFIPTSLRKKTECSYSGAQSKSVGPFPDRAACACWGRTEFGRQARSS
ncbi:MAG: hypothetical protein ACK55Z_14835, partial [bacterium]